MCDLLLSTPNRSIQMEGEFGGWQNHHQGSFPVKLYLDSMYIIVLNLKHQYLNLLCIQTELGEPYYED